MNESTCPTSPAPAAAAADWRERPFDVLRHRWGRVPGAVDRLSSDALLALGDAELLAHWRDEHHRATTGPAFAARGWYHTLYAEAMRGRRVLDVGAGLGIDGITLARHGAHVTFLDIVESNVALLRRLCALMELDNVAFHYMHDLDSLATLPGAFDVIWCQGSLINLPYEAACRERQALLERLPVGGRWIELAYPEERWVREGERPFERWGCHTDGPGTPWMEWYDLPKLLGALEPARFDVVLAMNFHNDDFNWFDLIRRA